MKGGEKGGEGELGGGGKDKRINGRKVERKPKEKIIRRGEKESERRRERIR